jgi:lipopolysaccharide export system permease protein
MKILDRYIIKKFLGTFIFAIVLIIGIAVLFDLTEKMDDFIEKKAPIKAIIFEYYLNFIPFYVNLFMFLFIFIAVIFFTSKMAGNSEIIAIISSGVSFNRLMYPYFLSALILGIFSFFLTNFIIPPANKVRLNFENIYINGTYYNEERNIHRQIEPGTFIFMESFNTINNTGYKFSIEKFQNKELKYKMMSDFIRWDSAKGTWNINIYQVRKINGLHETLYHGRSLDTSLAISPNDFKRRDTDKATMNFLQLNQFIKEQTMRGETNISSYLIEKHQRLAFPFSAFILTLIGVSISSRKTRGGVGVHIGIGLILSLSYLLFMQVSQQFSIKGNLSPALSAWIPNIIFTFIGAYLYKTAPK